MSSRRSSVSVAAWRRILVIRLSSLGDILLTTPILRLIRQHCPAAQIHFLIKAVYADLLRAHPCVDRVVSVRQEAGACQTVLHSLRQTPYDVVLDLHRTLRSRLLYHSLWARHKLAYSKRIVRRALLVSVGWNTLRAMTPVPGALCRTAAAPRHADTLAPTGDAPRCWEC